MVFEDIEATEQSENRVFQQYLHFRLSASVSSQILAALPYEWSGGRLLFFSCLRVVFIPLFVMCVYPASGPALAHPAWPCLLSLLMGVTNGYFGSVPMIQAAGKVPPEQRELAGELTCATRSEND